MRIDQLTGLLRFVPSRFSRRALLAGLAGGMLTADLVGTEAKKRKSKNNKKKRKRPTLQTKVDATCPGPGTNSLGDSNGNIRLAQTFTARATGELVQVELDIEKGAGTVGDFVLRLAPVADDGFPTNTTLEEATVNNFTVPEGDTTITFVFDEPERVEAGMSYALVLTRPNGGEFHWNTRSDNGCEGEAFGSVDQTSPFIIPFDGSDFIFTNFVRS
jgi:hypothetical protein